MSLQFYCFCYDWYLLQVFCAPVICTGEYEVVQWFVANLCDEVPRIWSSYSFLWRVIGSGFWQWTVVQYYAVTMFSVCQQEDKIHLENSFFLNCHKNFGNLLIHWWLGWLTECFFAGWHWINDFIPNRKADWLSDWKTGWRTDWLTGSLVAKLKDWTSLIPKLTIRHDPEPL